MAHEGRPVWVALAGALVAGVSAVLTFAAIGVLGRVGDVLPALMLGWWLLIMFLAGADARRVGDPPPDPLQ